jgi:hypothetical protein
MKKKTKSSVRRAGTKAASDAHAELEAMSLDGRIAAVAADVRSKRDEYGYALHRHEGSSSTMTTSRRHSLQQLSDQPAIAAIVHSFQLAMAGPADNYPRV